MLLRSCTASLQSSHKLTVLSDSVLLFCFVLSLVLCIFRFVFLYHKKRKRTIAVKARKLK